MRLVLTVAVLAAGLLLAPSLLLADHHGRAAKPIQAKPVDGNKRWQRPGQTPRYVCETEGDHTECTCKGILDCKALIDSGKCGDNDVWEDGDDPSQGGCG